MRSIFVFGSNLEGIHKKGAALVAYQQHGAIMGQGEGSQGCSYALPTKKTPYKTMTLFEINTHVAKFLLHASNNPQNKYLVTNVGCGLAGYNPGDIAPMFRLALGLDNVKLSIEFIEVLMGVVGLKS